MSTTPSYVSSVSLLPTVEFLEYIAKKQLGGESNYGIGISKLNPIFNSTTKSEWICLNSESEFLDSTIDTIKIKKPLNFNSGQMSPMYLAYNNKKDLKIDSKKLNKAKSLYLFRIDENGKNEIINISNYDKKPDNVTTATPIDCFSRECMTWFSSDVDWFIGFGFSSQSLASFVVDDNGIILSKSSDILSGAISNSVTTIDYTNIQVINTTSELSPWVSIQLSTGIQYMGTEDDKANILFIYSVNKDDDSLVAFAHGYTSPTVQSYDKIITEVSFNSGIIII